MDFEMIFHAVCNTAKWLKTSCKVLNLKCTVYKVIVLSKKESTLNHWTSPFYKTNPRKPVSCWRQHETLACCCPLVACAVGMCISITEADAIRISMHIQRYDTLKIHMKHLAMQCDAIRFTPITMQCNSISIRIDSTQCDSMQYDAMENCIFWLTFTLSRRFYPKRRTNEDIRSNQNQQKSNNMQVLWQVLVSLTQYM